MFTNNPFYHRTIRKYTIAFGTLFNNLSIERFDSDSTAQKRIKVPLAYGPKEKYLRRINEAASIDDNTDVRMVLPRMSFELIDLKPAPDRMLNQLNTIYKCTPNEDGNYPYIKENMPYDYTYELNIMVKFADDGLQCIEQILPYFTPKFNISTNDVPSLDVVADVPIILEDISKEDSYDGDFETIREITWTLTFTLKGYIYKPSPDPVGLIEEVIVDFYDYDSTTQSTAGSTGLSRIDIVATPEGANKDDATGYLVSKFVYPLEDSTRT